MNFILIKKIFVCFLLSSCFSCVAYALLLSFLFLFYVKNNVQLDGFKRTILLDTIKYWKAPVSIQNSSHLRSQTRENIFYIHSIERIFLMRTSKLSTSQKCSERKAKMSSFTLLCFFFFPPSCAAILLCKRG